MAEKNSSRQMSINLISSIIAFAVNLGINFFLTPYLVRELGEESYGFIGLSMNFVQYGTIVTAALNSMSGRFISVAYHKGDKEKASWIFSSVLVADLVLAGFMLILSGVITYYLDWIVPVPENLVTTVKITFGITFLTFVISIVTSIFTTAAHIKNRVELNSVREVISNLFRVVLIVFLFTLFNAQLYFLALAGLGKGLLLLATSVRMKEKVLPDVEINIKKFSLDIVKTLLMSGIWMSLVQLSQVLMDGLDLLICNSVLGASMMGLLSVSKTVSSSTTILISTLGSTFNPHYTILYSKNKIKELIKEVCFTSKITIFIMIVPITGIIVFGNQFYTLWQSSLTAEQINTVQVLSVIACLNCLFATFSQCFMMLYSVCNKVKVPVLINIGIGVTSTIIVLLTVTFFDLGYNNIYVIAGVSAILMSIRALTFVPIYSAKIIGEKWNVFLPTVLRGIISFVVTGVLFYFVGNAVLPLFGDNGWISFLAFCFVMGFAGYAINLFLLFGKNEIKALVRKLKK